LKELANANGSSSTEIGRCYRRIVLELDLKPPVVDAAIYAVRVAGRAHVSDKAANLSSTIARKSIERGLEGRNPVTLAAAAVYTASLMMGESLTQADAAEAAGIGEVSLRECAKEIRRLVGIS
jgi:transcription initiation factor TFIIB